MGFFSPERAQEALGALEMMDFEGIEKVKEQAREGQTLMNVIQQMQAQMQQMGAVIAELAGAQMQQSKEAPQEGRRQPQNSGGNSAIDNIKPTQTSYMQRLAARSKPDMNISK